MNYALGIDQTNLFKPRNGIQPSRGDEASAVQSGCCGHVVQFYEKDEFLTGNVSEFAAVGLSAGESFLLIATEAHRRAIKEQLEARGFNVAGLAARGRYVELDAAETLSQFMVDGLPDRARFQQTVGKTVAQAVQGGTSLRAFGEMVAVLWEQGNAEGAIALETLWNELAEEYHFCLMCGYPMDGFRNEASRAHFEQICQAHTQVHPTERFLNRSEDERLREIAALQQKALALEAEMARSRQLEERMRQLLSILPAAVYACDAEGRITFYNEHAVELWGLKPPLDDDHKKFCAFYRCWFNGQVIQPEDTPMGVAVREGKAFRDLEPVLERPDGRKIPVLVNIAPLFDSQGKPAGAINVFRDVSVLKSTQERLEARERHLRAVIETTPECVKMVARDGTLLAINGVGLSLVEAERSEEVVGRNVYGIIAPEFREAFRAMNERVCAGSKERLEFQIVGLRGTHRWMQTHAAPITDPASGQQVQLAITRDVTEQKRIEENSARLAAIVEHSSDAIFSTDLDGVINSWNRGAEQLYGYTAQEVIGKAVSLLVPEDQQPPEPQIYERVREGRALENFETLRRRKDGTLVHVALTISPIKDEHGRVIGVSKFARDITEKVLAKEKLERTVAERTAQLLDTVSELEAFSYSVAHDMRAPLRALHGYSRFLEEDCGPELSAKAREYLRRIGTGATRLDLLITDVLDYSKVARGEMPLGPVDLKPLTDDLIESYSHLRDSGASIRVEAGSHRVMANPAALTQCLYNLLSNAVKFVPRGVQPQVRLWAERAGDCVRISVQDNGIGISEEGKARIFRLFQRLNPASQYSGTGLGLTIVRKAVERMGGKVGVESRLGEGSTFWIELKPAP